MAKFDDTKVTELKSYFETGDQPTEAQFGEIFDAIHEGIEQHDHAGAGGGDAAQISTAEVANDAIDDTKAGNRVLRLDRRQGGHATNWPTTGTTAYTPTGVRMQAGAANWTGTSANTGSKTVTFPSAFSAIPLVFCIVYWGTPDILCTCSMSSADQFTVVWRDVQGANHTFMPIWWLAIGPE